MASTRPRRTRIYGANYDLGERNYKKLLEDIDNKRFGRASTPAFTTSDFVDGLRFREPILKNNIANERSSLFNKRATSLEASSDVFDDEFGSSLLSKKISSVKFGLGDGVDFGASARRHTEAARDIRKRFDDFDVDREANEGFVSRKLKLKSEILEDCNEEAEKASVRMKATKSRLADLESEMMDMSMKHVEREKRNQNLKRLLNDCDVMNDIDF